MTATSTVAYDDFAKVDIRAGTIVAAEALPKAREVLVLGFPDTSEAVVLVAPDVAVPNGARLF